MATSKEQMISVNKFLRSDIGRERFKKLMHYSITCDECGESIVGNVLATDLYKDSNVRDYGIQLLVHRARHAMEEFGDITDEMMRILLDVVRLAEGRGRLDKRDQAGSVWE